MIQNTNNELRKKIRVRENRRDWAPKPTTKGDLLRYLGIRHAMTVEHRKGGLREYWKTDADYKAPDIQTVRTPGNYKQRFGMSRHRFEDLESALRLTPPEDPHLAPENKVSLK